MAIGHCNGSLVMISLIYIFIAQPRESGQEQSNLVLSILLSIIFIILCRLSLISCYNCTFSLKLDSEGKKQLSSWWEMSGCWNVICHCPFLAALKVTSSVHLRSCVLGISLISAYILWVLARCMILLAKLVGWCWNITRPLCTVINIHSGHSAALLLVLHRTNLAQVKLTSASIHYKIDIYVRSGSIIVDTVNNVGG